MFDLLQTSFDNYNASGDAAVIAICAVVMILLKTSYVSRTRSLSIFMNIVFSLTLAAAVNIAYHIVLVTATELHLLIYVLRIFYQMILFDVFFLFTLYIIDITGVEHRRARIIAVASVSIMTFVIGYDIVKTVLGYGFRIGADGTVANNSNIFAVGFLVYIALIAALMLRAKKLIYKRVLFGFYGTITVSLIIRFGQLAFGQSSLTTMTCVFPVIAMLYIIHSNPYDVTLGSVGITEMEDTVRTMYEKKEQFIIMSLLLPEYDREGSDIPMDIQAQVRKFSVEFFSHAVLFRVGNGHLVLIVPKKKNPDYNVGIEKIMKSFYEQFTRFQKPYKIVMGESIDEISEKNEYVSLIRSIVRKMEENSVHTIVAEDVEHFNRSEYILDELKDIYRKHDVNDPRVLAFCQPVYNIKTGEFDTAEALMRLDLEKTGLVMPDEFISIAEDNGFIHVLTEIILNKTCHAVRMLSEKGYNIRRISVNVSVLELKDESFCGDVNRIILENSVPGEKIAIELTESRNEADFMIMKAKIEELRHEGLQFYLDDFGTGYSNMERIMELPFDIIKFDRSLVVASGTSPRSEQIVDSLAHMFEEMGYSVLYEGIEDEADVARCREMSASYLQGFNYAHPIPIEEIESYLQKNA